MLQLLFNKIIGSFQSLHVIWTVFISSHMTGLMFLENVHEDSIQIPKSDQPILVQPSRRAFKGFQMPLNV
jgi:hypothetical protein